MNDLAKHTAAVTDAMFNGKRVIKYTPERYTLEQTIEMAKKLEQSINRFTKEFNDHRGCLSESMDSIADIIANLEGHQRDIQEGKE